MDITQNWWRVLLTGAVLVIVCASWYQAGISDGKRQLLQAQQMYRDTYPSVGPAITGTFDDGTYVLTRDPKADTALQEVWILRKIKTDAGK